MTKPFNPIFRYPNESSGLFEGEKRGGKIFKNTRDMAHSEYGGWWPTFFPTAIGFLVTGEGDRCNVMTVSCIVVVNAHPFMLGMPVFAGNQSTHGTGPRYSLELLQANPEYTINVPHIDEAMNKNVTVCGTISGRDGIDKFEKTGLTKLASHHVAPPIIAECPLNAECTVHSMIFLGTHNWVIGKVEAVYLDEKVAKGDHHLVWHSLPELVFS
jgi:flavin reductase (DIM6/NTAB) family NADH-FMN oxidoreductase RutF